jgi:hypothetical protein
MAKFFCAEASRQAEEDIIGSGTPYLTYVLVEYPTPWAFEALDSPGVPQNLRDLVEEVRRLKLSIRFLFITQQKRKTTAQTKVLIYQQEAQPFVGGYTRSEWEVDRIEQVAEIVKGYLAGERTGEMHPTHTLRDILICTHGIHDQCCAKYGLPFYRQAIATVSALKLDHIRIWQASHFGGHRFAPTAIDLPDGRYYGALDEASFRAILTRMGRIQAVSPVYRGWGILPTTLQVLERELMLHYGWEWFTYKISHTILGQSETLDWIHAELCFEHLDGSIYRYQAELVQDDRKTLCLKGSCSAAKEATFIKYAVTNLHLHLIQRMCLSA